jgi:4-oxalocrotonate tautomerase
MPMITVQLAVSNPSAELAAEAARTVTEITARILRKDPRVTAVAVDFVDPHRWFVGGSSSAYVAKPAFFIDARISDGTNTKDEKGRYIAEAFAAFERLLGGARVESYVHVDDLRADGWGYGGLTQERRYIASHAVPAGEPVPA